MQSQNAHDTIRPCRNSSTPPEPKSQAPKKKKGQVERGADTPVECLEVRAGILDVQETLQARVRELRWKIRDENLNESSWTFLRDLTKDELLGLIKQDSMPRGIEWDRGVATIQVLTTLVDEGYARTILKVHFRGYGESKDKLVTPREWWALDSNGTLEESFIETLRKHFVPAARQ